MPFPRESGSGMRRVGDKPWLASVLQVPSSASTTNNWASGLWKPAPLALEILLRNQWRMKTKGWPADPGSPGTWDLEQRLWRWSATFGNIDAHCVVMRVVVDSRLRCKWTRLTLTMKLCVSGTKPCDSSRSANAFCELTVLVLIFVELILVKMLSALHLLFRCVACLWIYSHV